MSSYDQHQSPTAGQAYPPPPEGYPTYVAPPPPGYPTKEGSEYPQQAPVKTKNRGEDGFWKGCCAAICCCCVLETCCD